MKRSPLFIVSALALGAAPFDVGAWGFGRAQTTAVLGVPLDFSVGLRLEPGEAPPECLTVDVVVGDVPLPRSAVSAVLDPSATAPLVRVRTAQVIDEPLVTVNLSAGCTSRVTRRFTLLADPPGHLAAPPLASADAASVAQAATTVSAPSATPAPTAPAAVPAPAPAPAPPAGATSPQVPVPGTRPEPAPRAAANAGAPERAGPSAPAASSKPAPTPKGGAADPAQLAQAQAAAAEKSKPPAAPRPRLQLDAPVIAAKPGPAKPAAVLAAEEAASAARAAASAAEARAAAMEKNIEALRQEAKANRESLAKLTQALQEAQSADAPSWALWGALAGLAALSAVLMLRLRRQQRGEGATPWWSPGGSAAQASAAAEEVTAAAEMSAKPEIEPPNWAAAPGTGSEPSAAPTVAPRFAPLDAVAAPASRELPPLPMPEEIDSPIGAMEQTQLLPPSALSVSAPIQGVPIEELLDLEQQVEFFTVLGQDDAAEGLLVEHLRNTGGTYPLPYLKLLEIYRRKGEEDSYERIRDRFNQRFNAVVPAWGAAPVRDRYLEDLPEVLQKIEQVWPRPVDAMAMLENMLVRTEGGTLLEISALGEVLFLFVLARDLHEQEEGSAAPVDVLLPFDDLFDATPGPAAVEPPAVEYPATQFAASGFSPMGEKPGAAVAAVAALGGLAGAAAAQPAGDDLDHFDLPLGEPMFEPVFDEPGSASGRGSGGAPSMGLPEPSPAARPSIDLPIFGEDSPPAAPPPSRAGSAQEPLGLDLSYAPAGEPPGAGEPFLEPLSFDLPDLEAVQAPMPAKPAPPAVDLDFSLDGLELEPVSPKLTPSQEQAASNFGLFNEKPEPGKPR